MNKLLAVILFCFTLTYLQEAMLPIYFKEDSLLAEELNKVVKDLGLDKTFDVGEDGVEQISLAVVDLKGPVPLFAGVNPDNFIYPASVYKIYVAAEVLHQISSGKYNLDTKYVAKFPNVVDHTKEIENDPRPLLKERDTTTVNYLLDLMITRSDNSAANCLIDVAGRNNIDGLLHSCGWYGSEVTRKFLKRKF